MTENRTAYLCPRIFDGSAFHMEGALLVDGGRVVGIVPIGDLDDAIPRHVLTGGILSPGFVDLQVNGGGGVMLNDDQSVDALRRISKAHATLGATSILPTLITDSPEKTVAAIDAVEAAITADIPGIIGLHLEGPHLSVARKGAHEARFIRPMTDRDLAILTEAARRLPVLKMTVAVESVTPAQIRQLTDAGLIISLGHTEASAAQAKEAAAAGATCVTHLFNAMSQLGNREPGLVGTALSQPNLSAGLIADGIHVHPDSIGIALRSKTGPGSIFLVSDAMAVAGSDLQEFRLGTRRVLRTDGRLTLEDGTLAGADLDQLTAIRNLIRWGFADHATALAMATTAPAAVIGETGRLGCLGPGTWADFVHFDPGGSDPASVWLKGTRLTGA
ncbi:N-acetylglucosamine-6-phosphate deacetylase [Nioella aestuarii]|uniref:N-acetylglucosamine-6-phosphate deacetylase n=1 Tax=Nioella aestuarii TaxID=1662864 RepID=UPI003D7FC76D